MASASRNDAGAERARAPRRSRIDIALGLAGVALAGLSFAFPWHVYFNPQDYGPPTMTFSRGGEVPDGTAENRGNGRVAVGPTLGEDPLVDMILTGTAYRDGSKRNRLPGLDEQPFPGEVNYELVLAVNGRALVWDDKTLFPVSVHSILPDGSRVAAIRRTPEGWELVTTNEKVLRLSE